MKWSNPQPTLDERGVATWWSHLRDAGQIVATVREVGNAVHWRLRPGDEWTAAPSRYAAQRAARAALKAQEARHD